MLTDRPAARRRLQHSSTQQVHPARRRLRASAAWVGLAVLLGCSSAFAGSPASWEEMGRPLIHNYSRRDVGGGVQQWDVAQDARGIVYFANNAGVLEFDGRSWRLIELPSRIDVRALASDAGGSGRIYVGTAGDFGYLAPDPTGQLQFTSLLPADVRRDRGFDQVFTPASAPNGLVYFQSRTKLCQWPGAAAGTGRRQQGTSREQGTSQEQGTSTAVSCRETAPALSRIFGVGDKLYVQQQGVGLMAMARDGDLAPVAHGAQFAHEEIKVVLPFADGTQPGLLIGLRSSELFVLRPGGVERFAPALYDRRADERLSSAAVLPDGSFALATRLRGLLIVDRQGKLLRRIDRAAGLQDNYVHAVLPDRQGGLWLALQTGASRVEIASPFSVFDESAGLEQEWRAVVRHEGSLYVRGYSGLFEAALPLPARGPQPGTGSLRFGRVPGIEAPVSSFLRVGDRLLVSSLNAVDEIHAKRSRRLITLRSMPVTLYRSRAEPRRVYVGLADGLASLALDAEGVWRDEGRLPGIDDAITSIAEAGNGSLWLVSQRQRVLRVDFGVTAPGARPSARDPRVQFVAAGETLGARIAVQEIAGRPVFLSDRRLAEFDENARAFVAVPGLAMLSDGGRGSFGQVTEDRHGNVWVASRRPGAVDFLRKQANGSYRVDNAGVRQVLVWSIYPEEDSDIVWLCTPDYLMRYDPSLRTQMGRTFTTLIRKLTADEHRVVYGGAPMPGHASVAPGAVLGAGSSADRGGGVGYLRPSFTHGTRSLQFEFAATAFDAPERNEFQSRLEGFDREWSSWSVSSGRVYTNLSPGTYRFLVRARDIHGQVSSSAEYQFAVLPPWYRSRWAYALYFAMFAGCLFVVRRVELRQSEAKLRRERQSMEIEKLREIDSLKSRFFADISHELRTPLTLILAPLGQLLEEAGKPRLVQKLQLVRNNTEYLLRLIGQILDLSKLEARKMQLHAAPGDVLQCVAQSVAAFEPAAEAKGIALTFEPPPDPAAGPQHATYFDRDVVEKILNNVVGNALKFTPHGGTVSVSFTTAIDEAGDGQVAEIVVADTGVGIPADRLPHIFDRFYQVDGTRSREGIGIGLALVKELVELHHGRITVHSVDGEGTIVAVRMATGLAHLEPDEIAPALGVDGEPAITAVMVRQHAPEDISVAPQEAIELPVGGELTTDVEEETAVLVVEDNARVRVVVREQLQPYYRVLEAGNGAQGFDLAVSSLPDLVLSDVLMPGMNGYELCRALKGDKRTCHIPVVLLTARAGRADRLEGLDTGADSYLVKPFDSSEMLVQVRNLIEQRRRLRERFSAPIVLKPSEMGVIPMDEAFLQKVLSVVQANLADPDFDVVRLGREVGLSRSQLHRKLRALTNRSPTLLIRSVRLQRAAEMLQRKGGSVAEIAYCVGFSSQAYFAKCFREELGCSPKEYARNPSAGPPASAPQNAANPSESVPLSPHAGRGSG